MEIVQKDKGDLKARLDKMFAFAMTTDKATIFVDDLKSKKELVVCFKWSGTQEEFNEAVIAARKEM